MSEGWEELVGDLFESRVGGAEEGGGTAPTTSYGVFDRSGLIATGSATTFDSEPPTTATVYRIASCTKSFTATALLALRDAGTVGLDDPITAYVPAFADVVLPTSDSPVPTLRMLLTMSAGFPTDDPWGDRQESITDDELDALLRRGLRFDSVPGTRFAYSNLGYALLGRAIAVASGRPYIDVVTSTILEPLGLSSTTFVRPVSSGDDDPLAVGHRRIDDEWQPLPISGPGGFSPIGGLFSTVDDLSRWVRWLGSAFDPAGAADHGGILSRASRREMQQSYRVVPALSKVDPTGYGFGLFVEDSAEFGPIVSHSGGYPGYSAHMRWQPSSGLGVVAFENATYAMVSVPTAAAVGAVLLAHDAAPVPVVWPETAEARVLVEAALQGAELPTERVSENVEWDMPFTHRRAAWATAIDEIGGITVPTRDEPDDDAAIDAAAGDESSAPSHLVWRLPGADGRLRVEIRLTPEARPRIQTILVRTERT